MDSTVDRSRQIIYHNLHPGWLVKPNYLTHIKQPDIGKSKPFEIIERKNKISHFMKHISLSLLDSSYLSYFAPIFSGPREVE